MALLIYKQWHRIPNKKRTAVSNAQHIKYIGERAHALIDQDTKNGLFGIINNEYHSKYNINEAMQYVRRISKKGTTVFRSAISFGGDPNTVKDLMLEDKDSWEKYVQSSIHILAEKNNIKIEDFEYLAAVHDKKEQPHVHIVFWDKSKGVQKQLVNPKILNELREELTQDAIRQTKVFDKSFNDGEIINEEEFVDDNSDELRKSLIKQTFKAKLDEYAKNTSEIFGEISNVTDDFISTSSENIQNEFIRLIQLLPQKGRLTYGFLPLETKKEFDKFSQMLINENEVISVLVNQYYDLKLVQAETYNSTDSNIGKYEIAKIMGKSKDEIYKKISNRILKYMVAYKKREFEFDKINKESNPVPEVEDIKSLNNYENEQDGDLVLDYNGGNESSGKEKKKKYYAESKNYYVDWTNDYKKGLTYLYGNKKENVKRDFEKALNLFIPESEKGNALALHDIGRIYKDGLGVDIDLTKSDEYYSKALTAFKEIEQNYQANNKYASKIKGYMQYRIGKMYAQGLGTKQDYIKANIWLNKSVDLENRYAMYTLGSHYYNGYGVEKNLKQALDLYKKSAAAKGGNPYADYALGKMYAKGEGTPIDLQEADKYYNNAFIKFKKMEEDNGDDKLQYRLGSMCYKGIGTEKDIDKAISYLEKSSAVGNANAQYLLSKIYLETESLDKIPQAISLLEKSAIKGNNNLAQYALGKLYLQGEAVEKDIEKALEFLSLSAEQGNEYAQYTLGKLYLQSEDVKKDIEKALEFLILSAEQGNQYAQYTLGKLYLQSEDVKKDIEKALEFLILSAEQGNQYAQCSLGIVYFFGKGGVEKNEELAKEWLTLSAEQGNELAEEILHYKPKSPNLISTLLPFLVSINSALFDDLSRDTDNKNKKGDLSKERLKELKLLNEEGLEL